MPGVLDMLVNGQDGQQWYASRQFGRHHKAQQALLLCNVHAAALRPDAHESGRNAPKERRRRCSGKLSSKCRVLLESHFSSVAPLDLLLTKLKVLEFIDSMFTTTCPLL